MAAKSSILPIKYIWASALQGSADAFVIQSFATGLYGQTGIAYRIREILIEFPAWVAGNLVNFEVAFGIKSLAAMPNITDKSVIQKFKKSMEVLTSGGAVSEQILRATFQEEDQLITVSDPLYLMFDSNATSAANTIYTRLGYEVVQLNDVDRLSILASGLQ